MASTPNLDRLAALGVTGLYHSWLLGAALPSEIAHFLLFGYNLEDFPGRGYLEALGSSIPMGETDVALLGRIFAVRQQRGVLILKEEDPRVDKGACSALQEAIQTFHYQGVDISFVPTGGIRGIVLVQGGGSAAVTDSNPIYEGRPLMEVLPWEGYEQDERAQITAQALNRYLVWSYQQLSSHPLNRRRRRSGLAPLNAVGLQRAGQWQPAGASQICGVFTCPITW